MKNLSTLFKDQVLLICIGAWAAITASYFIFVAADYAVSPIAENGLDSLLTIYLPVLIFTVFLLLYLTRNREQVAWTKVFNVDKSKAKKEALLTVGYLLLTQLILGIGFNIGLHFPGTDIYSLGSHSQTDVWIWALTYTLIYTILPILWLWKKGLSFGKLFASFNWLRDGWIIVAYWALDFFGPIISGGANFLGGISAAQYAQGIPWGIFINSLGAGLPVLIMMHIIFIPRIAVIFENKLTVIFLGGLFYSLFSLFDQGVDYSSLSIGLTSFTYIIMTQTLVGMGKATFTVVTGNPFIHFISLHVISARVPFDTRMYIEIFNLK